MARQSITINTTDIARIIAAARGIVQFQADGHPVNYGQPQFLVSNLEDVKMSLIAAAMQNSRVRAGEFAKNGDVKVGAMRSASQGAFYILPAGRQPATSATGAALTTRPRSTRSRAWWSPSTTASSANVPRRGRDGPATCVDWQMVCSRKVSC